MTKSLAWHWERAWLWKITLHDRCAYIRKIKSSFVCIFRSKDSVYTKRARSSFLSIACLLAHSFVCSFAHCELGLCVNLCTDAACGGDADIFNVCFQFFLCLHHYVLHTLCLHKSMANIWFILFLSSLLDLFFSFAFLHVSMCVCVCVDFAIPNHCCVVLRLFGNALGSHFFVSYSFHLPLQVCVHPFVCVLLKWKLFNVKELFLMLLLSFFFL